MPVIVSVQCPLLFKVSIRSVNDPMHAFPKLPSSAMTSASLGARAVPDTTTVRGPLGSLLSTEMVAAFEPMPVGWKRIGKRGGQLRQRVVHEHALHLGRQRAGFLVYRHDPSCVKRIVLGALAALFIVWLLRFEDFVLRILELQPVRRQLEASKQNDPLVRPEHVIQKWLVEPDSAERTGAVADQQLEDLEPGPAGRTHAAADDLAHN